MYFYSDIDNIEPIAVANKGLSVVPIPQDTVRVMREKSDFIEQHDFRRIETKEFENSIQNFRRIDSFQSWREYSSAELDRMLIEDQEEDKIENEFMKTASNQTDNSHKSNKRTTLRKQENQFISIAEKYSNNQKDNSNTISFNENPKFRGN